MAENVVIAHHSAPEIDPRDPRSPPKRRGSIQDHPLNKLSVHDLRQLLDAKGINYSDCKDKDDLVARAIEKGLTNEQPSADQSGARRRGPEFKDGFEKYDLDTLSASSLRQMLRMKGIEAPESAEREELLRMAKKAGVDTTHTVLPST